tara:strand:- start:374 stop:871 length:498 start_codon:yes stop_codon:yes gene_type:complete
MSTLPKLVLTDIDGVWTDGGMFYDQLGNELKKFNTSDAIGVFFLKKLNIPIGIITGENTKIVANRAQKLKIDILYQGIDDKLSVVQKICDEFKISLDQIAYIGDDIGDYRLLNSVGFSAAPNNASHYVKDVVDFITKKNGGEGAFREFVEYIIGEDGVIKILKEI